MHDEFNDNNEAVHGWIDFGTILIANGFTACPNASPLFQRVKLRSAGR